MEHVATIVLIDCNTVWIQRPISSLVYVVHDGPRGSLCHLQTLSTLHGNAAAHATSYREATHSHTPHSSRNAGVRQDSAVLRKYLENLISKNSSDPQDEAEWRSRRYITYPVPKGTKGQSQLPRGIRHEVPSPAQILESQVRIPLEAWISAFILFVLPCVSSVLAMG
jgi:hypothetical protein